MPYTNGHSVGVCLYSRCDSFYSLISILLFSLPFFTPPAEKFCVQIRRENVRFT